jgi:hypothetical protein
MDVLGGKVGKIRLGGDSLMRHKLLKNLPYYILLSIPLLYTGMLFLKAFIYYHRYFGALPQIPFGFYSLLGGAILSVAALRATYIIVEQGRQKLQSRLIDCENHRLQERQEDQSLIAEFLVTQKLGKIFNSNLFEDLQKAGAIEEAEEGEEKGGKRGIKSLTGGYSGAKTFFFYRAGDNVPDVLKMATKEEIENEYEKFTTHVKTVAGRTVLPIGPSECQMYLRGAYGGLEYNFVQDALDNEYLTFMELYRAGLDDNHQIQIEISTIQKAIYRLFDNLNGAWKWKNLDLRTLNIYEQYYPFTGKFLKIRHNLRKVQVWLSNSSLTAQPWDQAFQLLDDFLDEVIWDERRALDNLYSFSMAMGVIHGDLNSRNFLLGVNPENYDLRTIHLVDFSHTGNGLTREQTQYFVEKQKVQLFRDRFGNYPAHIANDFCRLEADVKFYLTTLRDEQELRQAWILECVLLEYGLQLPDWSKVLPNLPAKSKQILARRGLLHDRKWGELTTSECWEESKVAKFSWTWQTLQAIRGRLDLLLPPGGLPQAEMQPFFLALLQATLTMIYYEDERFYNANLQKLYLTLAAGLLCEKLA